MHHFSAGVCSWRRRLLCTLNASVRPADIKYLSWRMLDLAPDIGGMRCLSRNATRKPTASDVDRTIRQNGYGVVRVGSRQYKVSQGDLIFVESLLHHKVRDKVILRDVLMFSSEQLTLVGRPHLKTAEIHTTVEEHFHEMQMPVYKRRRRKSSQCSASDRQVVTGLRIQTLEIGDTN
mmetsp:Transcript_3902/g.10576  ORF Transcript_3902/g.10576 Transcript_3902/m.10576 type:complete len:177 (-) Transcript_3902:1521-2051(-)